jgi:ABC-type spermidine/putrescine transport system permease subunit II
MRSGTRRLRRFFTITLPGCKYGLLSAFTVVFTYTISDFGAPKVIGGNFNVLAVDVFKQVIGQHNFSIGAVVGLLLLVPSIAAFAIDWVVRRRLTANLTTRSVPYAPKPRALFDKLMLAYCALVCLMLLAVLGMAVYTSLIQLWPYNLTFTLKHYRYALIDGDYAPAFWNSLTLGAWTALIGTVFVFCTAYLLEKTRGLGPLRPVLRLLALLSMAVPGLVLGLGYIMFFNHPQNPLNFLYQTMAILAISTVVHYYTSGHLTAVTALKSLDDEYEAVSASLKVPFYKTFWRVTVPVCLPAILEIARYYFVVSISTLSCVVFLYAPHTILVRGRDHEHGRGRRHRPGGGARHAHRARVGDRLLPVRSHRRHPAVAIAALALQRGEAMKEPILLTPGPLTTSTATKLAMVRDWGSRDTGFIAINRRVREMLLDIAAVRETHVCVPLQGSGTVRGRGDARHPGAEGTATCSCPRTAPTASASRRSARSSAAAFTPIDYEERSPSSCGLRRGAEEGSLDYSRGAGALRDQHRVMNPLREVPRIVARHQRSLLVDAMSSFAALPVEGQFDALVAASGKCLEGPPGMGSH